MQQGEYIVPLGVLDVCGRGTGLMVKAVIVERSLENVHRLSFQEYLVLSMSKR